MEKDWRGDIVFSDNVAVFRGHVGPNKAHSHWASQLTIALDGKVEFEAGQSGRLSARAVYLSSKVPHRLFSGFVCSIYFDPLSESRLDRLGEGSAAGWAALSDDQLPIELRALSASTDLRSLLNSEILCVTDPSSGSDLRFPDIVREIAARLRDGTDPDRDTLEQYFRALGRALTDITHRSECAADAA